MFGSFGTQQPQQQQQQPATGGLFGGSTFGAAQPQQTQQGGPSMFGGAQNTGTTGGGLFGSAPSQSGGQMGGGGLFGSTTTQQQPATGGGLFGSNITQQQPAMGGGLFGTAPTQQQPTTGGGLFQQQPTTGGGLFGSAQTQQPSTGGGLFGNVGQTAGSTQPGGGLFGGTSGGIGTTGGRLFGSTATTQPSTMGGGMFGSTTAQPAGTGGLFGSTATQPPTTTGGGGLFGSTTQPATTSGGLFGGITSTQQQRPTPLFGISTQQQPQQQQQQQQPSTLFGGPSQVAAQPGGLFGRSTLDTSTLGTSALGRSTPLGSTWSRAIVVPSQQPDPQSQFQALQQRIEGTVQAWNPNSPQCRFQHYFYNLVDPASVHLYQRPQNATNDALWQKAVRENPEPSCFVPVIASGFDDLQQRVDAQTKQASIHQENLKELKTRIEALAEKHQLSNTTRQKRAASLQVQITQRVLRVVQHLHLLIPTLRSSSIRPEEEELRAALEDIDEEIRRPGGMGKLRGKLNELWALVGAVNAARERDRREGAVEWAVVDEEGLSQIAQILADEQAGLAHVTKILQRDLKDLAVIQGVAPVEEPDILSASSLRGASVH